MANDSVQVSDLKALIHEINGPQKVNAFSESIYKLLSGVSTAGIIGLFVFMFDVKTGMTRIEANQNNFQNQMLTVNDFMKQPRVAKQDLVDAVQILSKRIDQNSQEISHKRSWESRMEPIVYSTQREVEALKTMVADLRMEIRDMKDDRRQ